VQKQRLHLIFKKRHPLIGGFIQLALANFVSHNSSNFGFRLLSD
jgi:hypothetical protein